MARVVRPQHVSTAARLQPHRPLEVRIDRTAHDSRADLPVLEEPALHATQPPTEIQSPGAGDPLICGDPGVGRDSGTPITPRTTHQHLIEEVIPVLALALIPKPVPGRLCIPAHSISLSAMVSSGPTGTVLAWPPLSGRAGDRLGQCRRGRVSGSPGSGLRDSRARALLSVLDLVLGQERGVPGAGAELFERRRFRRVEAPGFRERGLGGGSRMTDFVHVL